MSLSGSDKQKNALVTRQEAGKANEAVQREMLLRLKKIEGQVRGVQKMIQENRECGEIVTQLAAIKSAVNRVSINVLACHLSDQIKKDIMEERDLSDSLDDFMKAFKKFS
jgi:DNA-binding FrmR family transcriptional regulator